MKNRYATAFVPVRSFGNSAGGFGAYSRSKQRGPPMTYLIVKAAISGVLVMIISKVARRSPGIGGLIASLPLVSILAVIWLWRDTGDIERIAAQAESTFWFVLPSLPMFLLFPALLRHGIGFWLALVISCALTMVLYSLTIWLLPRFGVPT